MASARKKQDEKNLKSLRELVSLPYNKYCFDCNQRGPTYVNVTIGSFVCTKCSGMLRGLTPPHRVKSISMATFTQEEVELVQNRGNDYCRRTWLGLYEGAPLTEGRDEQQIHDLMVDKYERRRYYLDQAVSGITSVSNTINSSSNNIHLSNNSSNSNKSHNSSTVITRPNGGLAKTLNLANNSVFLQKQHQNDSKFKSTMTTSSPLRLLNGVNNGIDNNIRMKNNGITISRPVLSTTVHKNNEFVANFDSADIFNAANNNNNNNSVITNGLPSNQHQQQPSFANFDNNPVFTSVQIQNNVNQQKITANVPPAPPEDRYAALKDLDNALKNQSTLDWNSSSSNGGSLYSSPTPAGSVYSSSSPQSMYGSPSQGQFVSIFSQQETGSNTSNPFNNGQLWGNSSTVGTTTNSLANGLCNGTSPNPFRATVAPPPADPFKVNGFSQGFQQSLFAAAPINGSPWTPNPFKVTSNGHSNNPFL